MEERGGSGLGFISSFTSATASWWQHNGMATLLGSGGAGLCLGHKGLPHSLTKRGSLPRGKEPLGVRSRAALHPLPTDSDPGSNPQLKAVSHAPRGGPWSSNDP